MGFRIVTPPSNCILPPGNLGFFTLIVSSLEFRISGKWTLIVSYLDFRKSARSAAKIFEVFYSKKWLLKGETRILSVMPREARPENFGY